jgi:spermidine/putrescine transport system ATP-binding protein
MADVTQASGDLRLVALSKQFGDFVAVDHVDLTIPQGSFFALLGPSGCGKTTTLRMVAGLEEPTSGQVLIGDADISHTKPHRRPVNTVFQNYALFPHMNIRENVAFGLRRRGVADVDTEVRTALDLVQLGHLAKRKPAELSGGQQQRIALARAIVNRPAVLLLDEPLGALDLKLRRQMQVELKRIQVEVGLTFVHVTHDQEEAMTMADTIAVMNNGLIEQLGAPADLYENPRTAFVANFLGQSNLFRATVTQADGDMVVAEDADGRYMVPRHRIANDVPVSIGSKVLIGVRPEKLTVSERISDDGMNSQPGRIIDASFFGVSTQYIVRTKNGENWVAIAQNTGIPLLHPGAEVTVSWRPEYSFLLEGSQDVHAGDEAAAAFAVPGA